MKHYFVAFMFFSSLIGGLPAAWGDKKTEAKKHFEEGFKRWKNQDFNGAAAEFELSAKLYSNKSNLYNLANCYIALARSVDALTVFQKLLANYGNDIDTDMRKDIELRIQEINALLAKLKVDVNREGAIVKIDGKEVGASPLQEPLVLMPGDHVVEISLSGHAPIIKRITTSSGAEGRVVATFEEPKAMLVITANESGALVSMDGRAVGRTPLKIPLNLDQNTSYRVSVSKDGFVSMSREVRCTAGEKKSIHFDLAAIPRQQPSRSPKSPLPKILFWGGVSGTVVSAVVGGLLWGVGASKLGKYESTANDINSRHFSSAAEERELRQEADELKSQATNLNKAAVGMSIATGVFVAAAVVGFALKKRNRESSLTATITALPGGMEVRF